MLVQCQQFDDKWTSLERTWNEGKTYFPKYDLLERLIMMQRWQETMYSSVFFPSGRLHHEVDVDDYHELDDKNGNVT